MIKVITKPVGQLRWWKKLDGEKRREFEDSLFVAVKDPGNLYVYKYILHNTVWSNTPGVDRFRWFGLEHTTTLGSSSGLKSGTEHKYIYSAINQAINTGYTVFQFSSLGTLLQYLPILQDRVSQEAVLLARKACKVAEVKKSKKKGTR